MKSKTMAWLLPALLFWYGIMGQRSSSPEGQPLTGIAWQAGISLGVANCLTDIGGRNGIGTRFLVDANWQHTRFCGSAALIVNWRAFIVGRLHLFAGQVSANDNVLVNSTGMARNRYFRQLHFKSKLLEASLLTEWHLLTVLRPSEEQPRFSPYLVLGAGLFHYNPKAMYQGQWVELRPLHTEGQSFSEYKDRPAYSTFSWCLPAGAGLRYSNNTRMGYRLEMVYRFTGTDYLDDVSTRYIDAALFAKYLPAASAAMAGALADRSNELPGRKRNEPGNIRGNPSNKDAYFSFACTVSIVLGK